MCVWMRVEKRKENHAALKQKAFVLFNDNFRVHGQIFRCQKSFQIQTSIRLYTQPQTLPQPLAKPRTNPLVFLEENELQCASEEKLIAVMRKRKLKQQEEASVRVMGK